MKYLSIMLTDAMYKKVIDDKLDPSVPVQIVESIRHGKEDRWIPVDEKLPEDFEQVLCWYEYFRYGDYNCMFQTYGVGFYDAINFMCGGDVTGHKAKVLAWKPLPKPYRRNKCNTNK